MEPNDIFIYNNVVVKLTGRTATRQLSTKTESIYEVEPVDKEDGEWKKWVPMIQLFIIKDT